MAPNSTPSRDNSHDDASPRVQRDVSELLQQAGSTDTPRMPQDVAERIRASMAAEFGTIFDQPTQRDEASPQTPIIVPLPVKPSGLSEKKSRFDHDAPKKNVHEPSSGASVHSLSEARDKREGRRRNVWVASAAAAAVVVAGGVGVNILNTSNRSSQTAASPINVSDVRITQTNTKYTKTNLVAEAKKNISSSAPVSSSVSSSELTTKQGVNACISALKQATSSPIKSIHADFGTYENQPAVIVTLDYGSLEKVWVVQRSCTSVTNPVIAGPYPA